MTAPPIDRLRRLVVAHRWLVAVLAAGLLLRVAVLVGLPRPLMSFPDPNGYVRAAEGSLFLPLEGRTAGYPAILRSLHEVWPSALVPVVLQHLAALAGCVLLYVVARRLGAPMLAAIVPAALWALPIDWLWLEHQLMTETFGTLVALAAVGVAATVPLRTTRRAVLVGATVAVLAVAAAAIRPAFLAFAPGLGLALLLCVGAHRWRRSVGVPAAAAFAVTFVVLAGAYVALQERQTGYRGIVAPAVDLGAYPGIAPLADCSEFAVPPGTASLCEGTPPDRRASPDFYYFDAASPGQRLVAARPDLRPAVDTWGRRAAEAQGEDLWRSRLTAVRQLFGLGGLLRTSGAYDPSSMDLAPAVDRSTQETVAAVAGYYGPDDATLPEPGWTYRALAELQPLTRPPRILLLAALLLTAAGVVAGRGRARRAALALGVVAWAPLLYSTVSGGQYYTSVPSGQFIWRYALPSLPFVALAAVVGAVALAGRRGHGRDEGPGAA